jgi:peroxiredoxin
MRGLLLCSLVLSCAALALAAQVPRPAPPLNLITPAGERISLEDLKGKVVVLEFFLTTCPHCQRSAQNIMTFYNELRPRGLEVVGVAIDAGANQLIPDFARKYGARYPLTVGNLGLLRTFADLPATARPYVPYVFLIDRKGMIRFEHPGEDQAFHSNEIQNMRAELEVLLKEPAPPAKTSRK